MEVYLVGGAVRDALLGRPAQEHDWVVVGATPEEMLRLGYRQVGRDFPVFLHPDTREEYALARTERKTGPGHTGFVCHAGPDVTLEDDLRRRDLTVNAMARREDGTLVDPFGGRADLDARVLRHVSAAFVEDPLRVFRVARFAAQLDGFRVAEETLTLMRDMAAQGALAELAAERVWQELYKALGAAAPGRFFEVLDAAQAMRPWFDELVGLGVAFPPALDAPDLRFGALAWQMPPADVTALARRCRMPRRFQRLGEQVAAHGRTLADWRQADSTAVLDALNSLGALGGQRDPEPALAVVEACGGVDLTALRHVIGDLAAVSAAAFQEQGLSGKVLGEAIHGARRDLLTAAQQQASRG